MKRLLGSLGLLLLAVAAAAAIVGRADAISSKGVVRDVPYVVAFRPINSMSVPFTGTMLLTFDNGIISGTYTDDSVKPGGPLANRRNVRVTGGSTESGIHLNIGNVVAFQGTLYGETMAGSALIRGRIYEFEAQQGRPGHPLSDVPRR